MLETTVYTFLGVDIATGQIGVYLNMTDETDITIINPSFCKKTNLVNYLFTLDPKVPNDFVVLDRPREVEGGGDLNLTSFPLFKQSLDKVLGSMLPYRSTVEYQKLYNIIVSYKNGTPDRAMTEELKLFFGYLEEYTNPEGPPQD